MSGHKRQLGRDVYNLMPWHYRLSKTTDNMKTYAILVICFASASLASGNAGWDKINKYLVAQVDTDDVVDNMDAAIGSIRRRAKGPPQLL